MEYSSKPITIGDRDIRFQLWDTAGQERYKSVTKSYYKDAVGVIIVYDITKIDSFQHVQNWLNDAKGIAKPGCVVGVVGNKSDLKEERVVKYTDGAKFCQDNELIHFECSAVTGENIEDVFMKTARTILQKIDDGQIIMEEKRIDNFIINEPKDVPQQTCYGNC